MSLLFLLGYSIDFKLSNKDGCCVFNFQSYFMNGFMIRSRPIRLENKRHFSPGRFLCVENIQVVILDKHKQLRSR